MRGQTARARRRSSQAPAPLCASGPRRARLRGELSRGGRLLPHADALRHAVHNTPTHSIHVTPPTAADRLTRMAAYIAFSRIPLMAREGLRMHRREVISQPVDSTECVTAETAHGNLPPATTRAPVDFDPRALLPTARLPESLLHGILAHDDQVDARPRRSHRHCVASRLAARRRAHGARQKIHRQDRRLRSFSGHPWRPLASSFVTIGDWRRELDIGRGLVGVRLGSLLRAILDVSRRLPQPSCAWDALRRGGAARSDPRVPIGARSPCPSDLSAGSRRDGWLVVRRLPSLRDGEPFSTASVGGTAHTLPRRRSSPASGDRVDFGSGCGSRGRSGASGGGATGHRRASPTGRGQRAKRGARALHLSLESATLARKRPRSRPCGACTHHPHRDPTCLVGEHS